MTVTISTTIKISPLEIIKARKDWEISEKFSNEEVAVLIAKQAAERINANSFDYSVIFKSEKNNKIEDIQDVVFIDIPVYGDKMTINSFIEAIKEDSISENDGHGYFATYNKMSEINCFKNAPHWASHVIWFNK